jgi:NAD-dependent SIR2 family protein deacetylase
MISGRLAIAEFQKLNKLKFLISRNVDNVDLKSGIPPDMLAEQHENISRLRCSRSIEACF